MHGNQQGPDNLLYDFRATRYFPREKFKLIFSRTPERVMHWLKSGLGDGLPYPQGLPTGAIETLSQPKLAELAVVTRAIYRKQVLEVTYVSLSSGRTNRQIVPTRWWTTASAGTFEPTTVPARASLTS